MKEMSTKLGETVLQHTFRRWQFDRTDTVPIWTLVETIVGLERASSGSRYTSAIFESLSPPDHPPQSGVQVLRSQRWELFPPYYSRLKPGNPFTATMKMVHVGKTSYAVEVEAVDPSSTEVLAKTLFQFVNVGFDTHRPEPFPDWLRERYAHLTSQPRPTTVQVFKRPALVTPFMYSVTVPYSHIDRNNHVRQNVYIGYCFDCAACGARNGAYVTVKGDLARYKVQEFSALYQNEALEGDVLTVESWEEGGNSETLKFQVKKGSKDIVQMVIKFYTPSVVKKEESKL